MDELHVDEGTQCEKYNQDVGYIYGISTIPQMYTNPNIEKLVLIEIYKYIYRQRDKQGFRSFIFMFARRFWLSGPNNFKKWIFKKR